MGKKDDITDLLGETKPAAKTTAAAAPAAPTAKKAATKTTAAAAPAAPTAKKAAAPATERVPVRFLPGEREAMYEAILARFKPAKAKPVNSKDLAAELAEQLKGSVSNLTTRKLRPVLYSLAKREDAPIVLELSASKVLGMTVSRA